MRVALTLSLLLLAVIAPAAQAAPGETRIIVGRDPGLSSGERADIRHDAGVQHVENLRLADTEVVTTDDPKAALKALRTNPDVQYAAIDRVRRLQVDTGQHYQWALDNTGANLQDYGPDTSNPDGSDSTHSIADADMDVTDAWATSTGQGVAVGVIDTSVDGTHPDLAGKVEAHDLLTPHTFTASECPPEAGANKHGTHVSGIVAANADGAGTVGVAPGAHIVSLRVLNDDGCGLDSDIVNAFAWAGQHGIPIVNASLGGVGGGAPYQDVIAAYPNTLYVVAAGNSGQDNDVPATASVPCSVDDPKHNLVCVGASTPDDKPAYFSNYGRTTVDLFAPGTWILSTVPGGGYQFFDGTSMASPEVAGEAALVLAHTPGLTTTQLKATLLASAEPGRGPVGAFAQSVTGGRANALAALNTAGVDLPIDTDGDGIVDAQDACPTVSAATANGCPAPVVVTPAPTPAPVPLPGAGDADGDGRPDTYDLCPHEAAATTTGCPVPSLSSLKLRKARHRVTVKVHTSRVATVTVTVQRRACDKRGKHCKSRSVYYGSKTSKRNLATFTTRALARGRYRVVVRVSSTAGKAKPAQRSISV